MKTKTKTFDCVEMKRRGSLRIYETTKDMTFEEEVAYWRERSRLFREEQERLSKQSDRPSIFDAFGKSEQPRTAEDLNAQLAEERAAWDDA
jgi:hypothetical protein